MSNEFVCLLYVRGTECLEMVKLSKKEHGESCYSIFLNGSCAKLPDTLENCLAIMVDALWCGFRKVKGADYTVEVSVNPEGILFTPWGTKRLFGKPVEDRVNNALLNA